MNSLNMLVTVVICSEMLLVVIVIDTGLKLVQTKEGNVLVDVIYGGLCELQFFSAGLHYFQWIMSG